MKFFRTLFRKKAPVVNAPLYVTNTLSGKKEVFETKRKGDTVRMYNCGPTVYDFQHIGNLRSFVFADTLKRILLYNGYHVQQVINITDVGHLTSDADEGEDKLEKKAREENRKAGDIVKKVTAQFLEDLENLNIKTVHITFTKATDYIGEQIALVKTLEEKGYTYTIQDGVYFDTNQFPTYGKLGNINIAGLKEGARIGTNPQKRNPTDFALWKFSPKEGARQQEWDSPWGTGFPGWHLECTAMIFAELGRQIDIHTGGIDHISVHHNNEIAQAEAATGRSPYVRYWLHNAFITFEGQKISKSIGNTVLLRNLVDRGISALAYRYWLLTAHYRSHVNFTWEALDGAQTALARLQRLFIEELGEKNGTMAGTYRSAFYLAINDDLDTPKAIAVLWELVHDGSVSREDKRATLVDFDKVLGIGLLEGSRRLKEMLRDSDKRLLVTEAPDKVQELLAARAAARSEADWKTADMLRTEIAGLGFQVDDTEGGQELRKL
jgi:cysteinyl-tRNA synthetase